MPKLWQASQKKKSAESEGCMDTQSLFEITKETMCPMCKGRGETLQGTFVKGKYVIKEMVCPMCWGDGLKKVITISDEDN